MSAQPSDLYAFRSPDKPDTVTIIATYATSQQPEADFGDDVLYEIHLDVNGDARPDLSYQFRFRTELRENRRQFYSVTTVDAYGKHRVLADHLACDQGVSVLRTGEKVFAGERADAFFVHPGAIFDLGEQGPYAFERPSRPSRSTVHAIAVQMPRSLLDCAVAGVWTSASRREVRLDTDSDDVVVGPHLQVARLGNPLVGDVVMPAAERDTWNTLPPAEDKRFAAFVEKPEFADRLVARYPRAFGALAGLVRAGTPRSDLVALLLTGIPDGLVDGFGNATGETQADMLRLSLAVPPSADPNPFGLLGGDLAGFPNGRRPGDDVVSIMLRCLAGATFPLVDEDFRPDDAAALAEPGEGAGVDGPLSTFPYLGSPRV
ncbi:DUF4331 domain-containing protein [Actinoplanes sp. TBRC 11911]|uniref:DUF4331 domain-containing protein n=1 Tax=Actinoplanes sp. TBRC 11911 TaxID=2729386 RepID=UPI00145E3FE1|nr:DUF4331 domain-containing protein [Actinoplanes sp. TBRC 11911]NMO53614.1 DUF4331 domain-containing protein [Actinoplanes sp. TBRC 11911]